MKSMIYLSLLLLAACGIKSSPIDFGKTTSKELISQKGEPLEVESIKEVKGEIYHYEDNEKFQIKNDVVTHGFAAPKGDEKNLIYWKHKFKDCSPVTRMLAKPVGHELPEFEMKCDSSGESVIFTQGSEFVSRIIYHEKK